MRSTDVLGPRQRKLWNIVRVLVPRKPRLFFEGHPAMRGQLWYSERKLLYSTIRCYRPEVCFEIGTWKGGGSTLFIAQALYENGGGQLHTIEVDKSFFDEARQDYAFHLPHLDPHVVFHIGDYREEYGKILPAVKQVDFLLLDGAEDAEETMRQYEVFIPYLKGGSLLMAHDWFSEKARLLRPIVEQGKEWEIKSVLAPPRSVGLMLAVRRSS
jgi:predicted O-methyltransferase YrrM